MGAEQGERGGGEAGLHDGLLVGEVEDDDLVGSAITGVSGSAVIAVVAGAGALSSSSTSVVVPDRVIASTRS